MKNLLLAVLMATASSVAHAQKADKIITAGSAITETVCALGGRDKIIASDRTSLYPAKIQTLPSIGYRSGINSEGIISLQPTLVIAEKNYVTDDVLNQVKSAGIELVTVERVFNLDGTKKMIREIAAVLDKKADGEKLITSIEKELAETKALIGKSKSTPRVLCVYNRGTTIDAAGTKTFSDILPYAGAATALPGIDGYKPITTEALIAVNPDYILFFDSGLKSIGGIDGALKIPGIDQTTAGKKKQIISMDGIKLSNFGPRFGEATKELVLLLHPDLKK